MKVIFGLTTQHYTRINYAPRNNGKINSIVKAHDHKANKSCTVHSVITVVWTVAAIKA